MKQRSISVGQLPANNENFEKERISFLNYRSRLKYPNSGDTLFYSKAGRKHYENHSDQLLKIVLPKQEPQLKPLSFPFPRQNSLPPPHLQSHSPEFIELGASKQLPESKQNKQSNLGAKMDEELEKLKAQMDRQKVGPAVRGKLQQNPQRPLFQRIQRQDSSCNISLMLKSPQQMASPVCAKSEPKKQKQMGYLFTSANKEKYDQLDYLRSRNPSYLSSKLSII